MPSPKPNGVTLWIGALVSLMCAPSSAVATGFCAGHFEAAQPLLSLESPGLPVLPEGITELRAMFGRALVAGDFNGDAADDLAISHQQTGPIDVAGARGSVLVLPGGPGGPNPAAALRLTSESLLLDPPRGFGEALASADFNGDGFDDLAVGTPGRGDPVAGKVYVYYGSPGGIDPLSVQVWDRDVGDIPGVAGDEDGFGGALVTGYFDDDEFADLAIGAIKGFETPALLHAVVHVLFGSADGLGVDGNVGLEYVVKGGSPLGVDLRTRIDSNADGVDEIVVTPNFTAGSSVPYACLVHELHAPQPSWTCLASPGGGVTSANDDPGAFVVGDFDGDGVGELISGENGHSQFPPVFSGRSLRWSAQGNMVGLIEPEAQVIAPLFELPYVDVGRFGTNHAAADVDADGFSDLVVGEPGWSDAGVPTGSGRVHVLRGTPSGIDPVATQVINANSVAAALTPQANSRIGNKLVVGDFNADGCKELALALPSLSSAGLMNTGGVLVLGNSADILFQNDFDP